MINPFFKNCGPFKFSEVLKLIKLNVTNYQPDVEILDIKDLVSSNKNDITFYHSKKYKDAANKTRASFCLTYDNLKNDLPKKCVPLIVENVLFSISLLTAKFYPSSVDDKFDNTAKLIDETVHKNRVQFGKNVLIGENVSIGENCSIGHNSIIEKNVKIGSNCSIGSNVIIRNCLIQNNIKILDNCVIGKHGFGFFPDKDNNLRYPHIGIVVIEDNCEIGCGSTIDRGSMSNTVIGKNSIIAGQVGIAGSSVLGENVKIGGQAGISGHLKIGNNVEIGGGSGVIKDIPDNSKVMGYPAKKFRDFLKENR